MQQALRKNKSVEMPLPWWWQAFGHGASSNAQLQESGLVSAAAQIAGGPDRERREMKIYGKMEKGGILE